MLILKKAIVAKDNEQIIGLQFHPDFHDDLNGTGALKYFYDNYPDFQASCKMYAMHNPLIIEPDNPVDTYASNVLPLLNFSNYSLSR